MRFAIRVPGDPVPQPRIKATCVNGKPRVYAPNDNGVNEYKQAIQLLCRQRIKRPATGPVRVDCQFVFKRPERMVWKTKPMPRVAHDCKPDVDNIFKAAADAMTGIVFEDDGQVFQSVVEKWYAAGDEQPHTLIIVTIED